MPRKKVLPINPSEEIQEVKPFIKNHHEQWLKRYRPKMISEFFCFREETEKMKEWMEKMKSDPHSCKKVLYMVGASGIGKTTMAEVLFEEMGYRMIEYNSSELRSQKKITEVLEKSLTYRNVFEMMDEENKPVGFLIDELESLIGTGDKGGFSEFLDILKCNTKFENHLESLKQKKITKKKSITDQKMVKLVSPIICTSFESNEKKIQELKRYSEVIYLKSPIQENVDQLIDWIGSQEGFEINQESKDYLFQYIRGDIRKLIISLEQIFTITQQKKILINIDSIKNVFSFLSEKDEDDLILKETEKIFTRNKVPMSECMRIFSKECLLLPLTMYQNTIQAFKHSKISGKEKLHNYRKTLSSICHHDILQTIMFKNDDYMDDEFYESACLYSMKIPNMYLQKLRNDDEEQFHFTYENTNLLNKISQMLVNKKMLQNSRKSIQKLNVETDEVLYIVNILSHFLGDLKNQTNEDGTLNVDTIQGSHVITEGNHELTTFMNKYGITLEDFENIMKIDKLNKVNHTSKKKKLTMKMKKEIEGQLIQ